MGHKPKTTKKKDAEYKRLAAKQPATPTRGDVLLSAPLSASPMTDREAEAEAQRLWGEKGVAWHPCYSKKHDDPRYCCVGMRRGDVLDEWEVYGHGETWEAAFSFAKARGH